MVENKLKLVVVLGFAISNNRYFINVYAMRRLHDATLIDRLVPMMILMALTRRIVHRTWNHIYAEPYTSRLPSAPQRPPFTKVEL